MTALILPTIPRGNVVEEQFSPAALYAYFEPRRTPEEPAPPTWRPPLQVLYLANYLRDLACSHIVFEEQYVDRDYREDFGTFYSQSFVAYRNSCSRLHFFGPTFGDDSRTPFGGLDALAAVRRAVGSKANAAERRKAWAEANRDIARHYRGYAVIRPLYAAPLGRTVLMPYPLIDGDRSTKVRAASQHQVNLAGFRLEVRGVVFQQQDRGTSACATTAIWTALHTLGEPRGVPITPAEITRHATAHSIPHGRALPSEGLNVAQMCDAIRALGYSPYLYNHATQATTRALLHLAVQSPLPTVAIAHPPNDAQALHAFAIVGGKLVPDVDDAATVVAAAGLDAFSASKRGGVPPVGPEFGHLQELYVHDDRIGPYAAFRICDPKEHPTISAQLKLPEKRRLDEKAFVLDLSGAVKPDYRQVYPNWQGNADYFVLRQLLFPLYPKISISLRDMVSRAIDILEKVGGANAGRRLTVWYDMRLVLGSDYLRDLVIGGFANDELLDTVCRHFVMSRYVVYLRLSSEDFPIADVVFDTTGTDLHAPAIGVLDHVGNRSAKRIIESIRTAVPQAHHFAAANQRA